MGRKKIDLNEKKIEVRVYIENSKISLFGGLDSLKKQIINFINKKQDEKN